ncbi:MAG: hypothetical protein RIC55_21900 [Pirellulaceae bacterium]
MNEPTQRPVPRAPQFDLSAMMMLLLVVGVAAGIAFYLVRGQLATNTAVKLNSQFLFIMLTLSGPMLLMVLVSVIRGIFDWLSGNR